MRILRNIIYGVLSIIPGMLWSCPYCAGKDSTFSDILLPVAALLGAPFVIFGVIAFFVVKSNRKENQS
jgi:hypothetical protein